MIRSPDGEDIDQCDKLATWSNRRHSQPRGNLMIRRIPRQTDRRPYKPSEAKPFSLRNSVRNGPPSKDPSPAPEPGAPSPPGGHQFRVKQIR
jgi:hypothetical protein